MASQLLTVALLPHASGINGVFRIHLPPTSLERAGLTVGQHCELLTSDDRSIGFGMAWRALDRSKGPADKSVKITETMQSVFNIANGTQLKVVPAKNKIVPAKKIIIADITPTDYGYSETLDDNLWKTRIAWAFSQAEALAPGLEFDHPTSDQAAKKLPRRRFKLLTIESASSSHTGLARYNDNTVVELSSERGDVEVPTDAAPSNIVIIGGMTEQVEYLNMCAADAVGEITGAGGPFQHASSFVHAILIHGSEGTGKTTLLNHVASIPGFRKIYALDARSFLGKPLKDLRDLISTPFEDAVENQPSLITIDNLDSIAQPSNYTFVNSVVEAFARVAGKRVMVVAATRSVAALADELVSPQCFFDVMELNVPDRLARQQILTAMSGGSLGDEMTSSIADRTQGFNAADLQRLYFTAERAAAQRRIRAVLALEAAPSGNDAAPLEVQAGSPSLVDFEASLRRIQPSALGGIGPEIPSTRWADIGGSQYIQDQFDMYIGWSMRQPDLMRMFNHQPPRGVLLYGPPGCSKTLTARAVANSYNYRFIAIKGAEQLNKYVGESERAVRDVFAKARAVAPCVIFFDEIDAIGARRSGDGSGSNVHVLSTLLNEIDGFEQLKDVLILAATNVPQSLDDALIRPGRFDRHIYIGPPGAEARKQIVAINTKDVPLADDVDMNDLVAQLEGYSGAEIVNVVNCAKDAAIRRYVEVSTAALMQEDFQKGIESIRKSITPEMLDTFEEFRQVGQRS